jgi:hypothetical protein
MVSGIVRSCPVGQGEKIHRSDCPRAPRLHISAQGSGAHCRRAEEDSMSLAVHKSSEIGKTVLVIVGILAFVVVALTWIPEMIAPAGGPGGSDTGRTVKMIK